MSLEIVRAAAPDITKLAKSVELSPEVVSRTLEGASTAIDHHRILVAGTFKEHDEIFVNAHGDDSRGLRYHIFRGGRVDVVTPDGVVYKVKNERTTGSTRVTTSPVDIIGATEEERDTKVTARQRMLADQSKIEEEHELGPAAYVVLNEFGGFDYRDPAATARHLALRGLIMSQTNFDGDPTQIGMLHPLLRELMGGEFKAHMHELGKLFGGVALMSEARREPFLGLAFEQAIENSEVFIETHKPALELTATALVEPELLQRVMAALNQNGQLPKETKDPRAGLERFRASPVYPDAPRQ